MKLHLSFWGTATVAALTACTSNPVATEHGDDEEALEVTLSIPANPIETLATAGFEISVRDHQGSAMMDFEAVMFEYRLEGETEWVGAPMSPEGTRFHAPVTFFTSGDYELRVSGQRHGGMMGVLHQRPDHLEVLRAHVETADMRIEFETYPGHLEEGAEAEMRFWVFEKDPDLNGIRHAITGLSVDIHCEEEAGFAEEHAADEHDPGVYEAHHTFAEAGGFHAEMHFTDPGGQSIEVGFHTHVEHGH